MQDGVRFAKTDKETQASYQVRYSVYVEGMGRFKDKANHQAKELQDEYDKAARSVVVIKDKAPIGTVRLFWGGDAVFPQSLIDSYQLSTFLEILPVEKICILERLVVNEAQRGSTATIRMYKEIMRFILEKRVEAVLLVCEPHHLNSYLKLGFRPFSESYSYPGIGIAIPMILVAGDHEHLVRVGSPFSMMTRDEDFIHCKHTIQILKLIKQDHCITSQSSCSGQEYLQKIYVDSERLLDSKPKIFDGLDSSDIQRVIEKSHIIECLSGDLIIDVNNSAKTIFVLLSGVVEVKIEGELKAVIVAGEIIGEISFFIDVPRSASVIAATKDVRLLSLDDAALSRLLKFDYKVANKLLMNICRVLCCRLVNN